MPAPTKLFDVTNGNGATINAETVDRGTLIWYRDNVAKNKVIDNFVYAYGYTDTVPDPNNPGGTIPNPQGKQAFFNRQLTAYIKDIVRSRDIAVAANAAAATAGATIDVDLPNGA